MRLLFQKTFSVPSERWDGHWGRFGGFRAGGCGMPLASSFQVKCREKHSVCYCLEQL